MMNQKPDDYSNLYGKPQVHDPIPQRVEPVVESPSNPYENLYGEPQKPIEPTGQTIPETVYFAPQPPPQPKKPFSPIPLLLIAGVGFLFLGGIIFLTSTWQMLPNPARAIALLSASAIAFGANRLAEKVLKLPKTGLAFYILGCIFLPLALGGIGQFELFGHWFSFHGEGSLLLKSVIYLCIAGTSYLGRYNYQSKSLAWLSLSGIAGAYWYFNKFLAVVVFRDDLLHQVAVVLFAVGATFWAEWYLKRKPDTPTGKVAIWFLYPLLYVFTFALFGAEPLAQCILSLIMAVLFVNERFLKQNLHTGVVGFAIAVMTFGYGITNFSAMDFLDGEQSFLLVTGIVSVFMLAFENIPKLKPETVKTFKFGGYLFSIPMILIAGAEVIFDDNFSMWIFPVLMITAIVFMVKMEKYPLPTSAFPMIFQLMMVFVGATYPEENVFVVLLVISALLLLVQAFISKKLWCFGVSIGTCAGIIAMQTEHPLLWVQWVCAVGLLAGMVYAHTQWRFVLEKCFALTGCVFFVTALQTTLDTATRLSVHEFLIIILAIIGVLYIVESMFLWQHLRTVETKPFLEAISVEFSLIAVPAYLIAFNETYRFDKEYGGFFAWGLLLCVILIGFSAVLLRKDKNAVAIPQLVLFFFTAREMIGNLRYLSANPTTTSGLKIVQVILLLAILATLAILGRILLPQFRNTEDGKRQTDWALLTGIFAIFSVATTIDWYPSILVCLFLSIYSLLYVGRVQNRYVPALLASLFGCLTIFFHNVNDPFDIIHDLRINDINTLQILMYLLPIHLFIFSLLFILPEVYKENVHQARFVMYCITMMVLLVASLGYGNVTDAILLVVFSFGILLGSFAVKRLRWFTLGFAMLVFMTIRMTWKFWTSLHWGIYLFLAGLILIGLASFYEYSARYAAEHPDEPKKKFQLFATWKW